MRYCSGCGTELPDGAVFCPSCGRRINSDACSENTNNSYNSGRRTFDSEYCQSNNFANLNRNSDYEKYSPLSILGLIFAFVAPVIGLILSIFAYNEAKSAGSEKNQSLSKAGIILSAVLLSLEFILAVTILSLSIAGVISLGSLIQKIILL